MSLAHVRQALCIALEELAGDERADRVIALLTQPTLGEARVAAIIAARGAR